MGVDAHGIASVAVLGGGTMGGGIAGHLARAGLDVALADADPELTRQARERLLAREMTALHLRHYSASSAAADDKKCRNASAGVHARHAAPEAGMMRVLQDRPCI